MPTLIDTLRALTEGEDRRPLVQALHALALLDVARAAETDPFNQVLVDSARAWLDGGVSSEEASALAARASRTRGSTHTGPAIAAAAGTLTDRQLSTSCGMFAIALWRQTPRGRAWTERFPARKFADDPQVKAEIDQIDADLADLAARAAEGLPAGPIRLPVDARLPPAPTEGAEFAAYLAQFEARATAFEVQERWSYPDRSPGPRVDLLGWATADRVVIVTAGMACVDRGDADLVELAMVLPAGWPLADFAVPQTGWPFRWLRTMGKNVHRLHYGPLPADLFRMPPTPPVERFAGLVVAPGVGALAAPLRWRGRPVQIGIAVPVLPDEHAWSGRVGEDVQDGAPLLERLLVDPMGVMVRVDRPTVLTPSEQEAALRPR